MHSLSYAMAQKWLECKSSTLLSARIVRRTGMQFQRRYGPSNAIEAINFNLHAVTCPPNMCSKSCATMQFVAMQVVS